MRIKHFPEKRTGVRESLERCSRDWMNWICETGSAIPHKNKGMTTSLAMTTKIPPQNAMICTTAIWSHEPRSVFTPVSQILIQSHHDVSDKALKTNGLQSQQLRQTDIMGGYGRNRLSGRGNFHEIGGLGSCLIAGPHFGETEATGYASNPGRTSWDRKHQPTRSTSYAASFVSELARLRPSQRAWATSIRSNGSPWCCGSAAAASA